MVHFFFVTELSLKIDVLLKNNSTPLVHERIKETRSDVHWDHRGLESDLWSDCSNFNQWPKDLDYNLFG